MERPFVKKVSGVPKVIPQGKKRDASPSRLFVFCEKSTGVAHFRTESSGAEGALERMAGLLAMQCLVRGADPEDFAVLVTAEKKFATRLVSRAKELLEEGRAATGPISLSPRQTDILRSVICNRANKEIACRLNISVRTVKFHISSLLGKFGVGNRAELARRAAPLFRPKLLRTGDPELDAFSPNLDRRELAPVAVISAHRQTPEAIH